MVAHELVSLGATVLIAGRRDKKLKEVAGEIEYVFLALAPSPPID